ncbi:MAG: GNAT family N-acetyltransferase [Rhizobacter sp.]|nr:GNAT family N-acetyltransferase [Rhizobacter sp.]
MASPKLTVHEVDGQRWDDFARLFESKGAPKYCWCMAWRHTADDGPLPDNASRKAAMKSRVDGGVPIGLLGYIDGEPVAWCSIAPRASYRPVVRDGSSHEGVWSIACFYIRREWRGQGLTRRLLAAALKHGRARGAKVVEAYPVDEDSPSYRYMGFVPLFADAGFVEIGREGSRRHVMRRKLRAASRSR